MRIIAGSAKGVRLAPVPAGTRPVSDRAREGVFSSLGESVTSARLVDLYAGTGAMGIEALSRGATVAWFVDRSARAVATIRENLRRAGLPEGAVLREDVRRALRGGLAGPPGGADLVFMDPPYGIDPAELADVLRLARDRIAENATIVLTRPSTASTDVIPVHFQVAKTLRYGDTLVHLIREDPRARERSVSGDV